MQTQLMLKVGRYQPQKIQSSHLKEVGCLSLKAGLDSTIFAYDYRARLAYVMAIHTRTSFTYHIHNVSYEYRGCNLHHQIGDLS